MFSNNNNKTYLNYKTRISLQRMCFFFCLRMSRYCGRSFRWLSERGLRKPEIVSQLCMVSVELFTSPRKQFVCTCNIPRPRNR